MHLGSLSGLRAFFQREKWGDSSLLLSLKLFQYQRFQAMRNTKINVYLGSLSGLKAFFQREKGGDSSLLPSPFYQSAHTSCKQEERVETPHREGGPLVQLAGQQMSTKTTLLASEVQHNPLYVFFRVPMESALHI